MLDEIYNGHSPASVLKFSTGGNKSLNSACLKCAFWILILHPSVRRMMSPESAHGCLLH